MAYAPPTSDDLIARYPAFANVSADTIDTWLLEAEAECAGFPEDYRARAELAYAAHMMADTGTLTAGSSMAGVTSFRSADFSATFSDAAASRTGFNATSYGREFLALRRRFFGGPRLIGCA